MKVRRLMSFALSVFLTLIPINPNVAFAGVGSQRLTDIRKGSYGKII